MPYGISYNLSGPSDTSLHAISEVVSIFAERWRKEAKLSHSQWLVWVLFARYSCKAKLCAG